MACDAQSLINTAYSNGYAALSERDLMECTVAAACAGGGSGGGITCGAYGGGQPNFTPATGCAAAVDTDTGRFWLYFNGAWN